MEMIDRQIRHMAGAEPHFDEVMAAFLENSRGEFVARVPPGGILEYADLGEHVPWLWRLTFHTHGLVKEAEGVIRPSSHHVVAVRFLPDYLRHVDRFATLALLEPTNAFHPNLMPPGICLEVYPGETLLELAESLHNLFSWRLRQLAENDALNREACMWGRAHLKELPLDPRPLLGQSFTLSLEPLEERA